MSTPPALIKRRRRTSQPLGEGQSSASNAFNPNSNSARANADNLQLSSPPQREASAESNDESGAYDDDEFADDSSVSPSISRAELSKLGASSHLNSLHFSPTKSNKLNHSDVALQSEASAGHDGDISSATAQSQPSTRQQPQLASISSKAAPSPAAAFALAHRAQDSAPPSPQGSPHVGPPSRLPGHGGGPAPPAWAAAPQGFLSSLTEAQIQSHIRAAIAASDPNVRPYRIAEPPTDRPVRIYADGVYDLLHYGHMLQLRQCKLAFPSVHLMAGVCSDELVRKYKASPVMTSVERYESVRHCKWVDEVVEDAPWLVDQAFFDLHEIDYVAHDEEPYASADVDDTYAYAKSIGKFLPTKRTNGVSTSELLQRIVEGYREGEYDNKFIKLGVPELCSTRNGSEAGTHNSKKDAHEESPMIGVQQEEELETVIE